jgi:hypothetical protein
VTSSKHEEVLTIPYSDQRIVYASKKFETAHKDYPLLRTKSRAIIRKNVPVIESLIVWKKI